MVEERIPVIVYGSGSSTHIFGSSGDYAVTVTIAGFTNIVRVLGWNISTNPPCDPGSPINMVVTKNVVGCTLVGVGAGTTLTIQMQAVGR